MLSLIQWWPILMMIVMIVLTANSMMSMKTWWLGIDLRITRVRFPQITGALNFLQCGVLSTVRLIVTQRTAGSIPVQCTAYTYSSIQVYWSTYCSVQVHQYDSSVYQSKTTAECGWKPSAPRLSEEPSMRPIWPALGLPLNFRTIQCNKWYKYKQANHEGSVVGM